MAEEENIKVVVRIRDLIPREKGQEKVFSVMDAREIVRKGTDKTWTFDRVYNPVEDNRAVYADTVGQMIEDTVNGFNSTVFAYGQTSSGKTHTMYGNKGLEEGVIDMAVNQLFYAMEETPNRKFLVTASFIEIYNETVVDLLADPRTRPQGGLKIRENEEGDVYVENLQEKPVSCQDDIFVYMKEGEKSRKVGATNMNERSSRSHTIFRLKIESSNRLSDDDTITEEEEDEGEQIMASQLNLVDLAGSERAAQTGAGGVRLKEGCNINQSLMTLGQVIQKLSSGGNTHIPYRDSKLTRILQNSLGGNAKTAIICTVTPAAMSEEQTISTLRFASEAKKITNHAKVNEILDHQGQISRLKKEMEELKKELENQKKINTNEMLEDLREKFERERNEKEQKMKEIESLQMKVITSSQPAPPRKSMMVTQSRKARRETWCGPNLKRAMRHSLAPSALARALPDLDLSVGINPSNSGTPSFEFTPTTFEEHLNFQENEKLDELEEESETSWLKCTPSPVVRKKRKTVNFVQSPQFLSPRKVRNPNFDLNCTDDGATPKAVIRDKYKRVSLALSTRELELERERQGRLELENELQELQEFTRLEDESGVYNDTKAKVDDVFDDKEKLRNLERSCRDSEQIIIDLRKDLDEKKKENVTLSSSLQDTQDRLGKVTETEKMLALKVEELEPLVSEVKVLREKSEALERNKEDFDMELELALKKKETTIKDLREYLESAYEEIALNENSNKDQVRKRYGKIEDLQREVDHLKEELGVKENLLLEERKSKENLAQQQPHVKPEGRSLVDDEEIERLQLIERNFGEIEQKMSDHITKNSYLENSLTESKRTISEKDALVLEMESKISSLNEEVRMSNEAKLKIEEELKRELDLKEGQGKGNTSDHQAASIQEKDVIIDDLKLCIEEQSKDNEEALLEIEREKEKYSILKRNYDDNMMESEEILKAKIKLENELKLLSQTNAENEEEIQGLVQKSLSFENAIAESHRATSEKDARILELEARNSSLDDDVKTTTEVKVKLEEEFDCLKRELEELKQLKEGEGKTSDDQTKTIQEKNVIIEDLKLCIEEQSKENEEVLLEFEREKEKLSTLTRGYDEKVSELEEILKAKVSLENEVKVLSQTNDENEEELQGLVQKNSSYENALLESQRSISERDTTIADLENKNKKLTEEMDNIASSNSTNEDVVKTLEEKIISLTTKYEQVLPELETSHQKNCQLESKIKSLLEVNSKSEGALKDLVGKMASLDEELSELKMDLETSYKVKEDLSLEKQDLQQQNSTLSVKIEDSERKISELTILNTEIQSLRSVDDEEKSQLQSEVEGLLQKISSFDNALLESQKCISERDCTIVELGDKNKRLSEEKESLVSSNSSNVDVIKTLEAKYDSLTAKYEQVVPELETSKEQNCKLENKIISLLEVNKKLTEEIDSLASSDSTNADVVKTLEAKNDALTAQYEVSKEQNCKLENKILSLQAEHSKSEGALKDLVDETASKYQELSELKDDLETLQKGKDVLLRENQDLLQRIEALALKSEDSERKNSELTILITELESNNVDLQEELENIKLTSSSATSTHSQQLNEFQSKLSLANQEKTLLQNQLSKATDEFSLLRQEKENIEDKIASITADHTATSQKLETLEAKLSVVSKEKDDLQCHISQMKPEHEVQEIQAQVLVLSQEKGNLLQKIQDLENQSSEKESVMKTLESKIEEHLKENDNIKFLMEEAEKQRDMVDEACDKLEAELEETKKNLKETQKSNEEKESQMKQFEVKNTEHLEEIENLKFFLKEVQTQNDEVNVACDKAETEIEDKKRLINSLNEKISSMENLVQKEKISPEQENEVALLKDALMKKKEELGERNIELASLKVDVERGEMEYKKRCEILQADLEYEKAANARMTQEIRRQQSASLDTTCFAVRGRSVAPSTQAPVSSNTAEKEAESPVWSSGSGALKEMQLHDLQVKTKTLEKDNARLKEHEEFYINKAREWKNRALKYERFLKEKGYDVPSRDTGAKKENKENTSTTEGSHQATQEEAKAVHVHQPPPSPTINLNLHQQREPRRTEEDFRLPEASRRKQDDCKTQ